MVDFYKALQRLQTTAGKTAMLRNKQTIENKMAKPDKKPAKKAPANNGGSKRTTLADLWDETDPGEASNFIPEGEHEVRLNEIEHKVDKKKGEAAFAHYEILEGEFEGRKGRQMYKLTDEAGNKAPGMAYLMRDLALLDYKDISGKALLKTLKEIGEEQPMVVINAKESGVYTNYFLQGLVGKSPAGKGDSKDDDDEIEVGDKVKWDDDGTDREGEVISINKKKETAKVKDSEDDEFVVDLDDLEKSEGGGDADTDEIEIGDNVKGENDSGDKVEGEVVKIKGDVVTIKDSDGDKHKCDKDDLKKVEAGADADDDKIEVGDKVTWEDTEGDTKTGKVKKIKDNDDVIVIDEDDDKHTVDIDDLTKVEDDD